MIIIDELDWIVVDLQNAQLVKTFNRFVAIVRSVIKKRSNESPGFCIIHYSYWESKFDESVHFRFLNSWIVVRSRQMCIVCSSGWVFLPFQLIYTFFIDKTCAYCLNYCNTPLLSQLLMVLRTMYWKEPFCRQLFVCATTKIAVTVNWIFTQVLFDRR